MSDEPVQPKTSDYFRQMADRIDHNAEEVFGGAFVIVPPGGHAPLVALDLGSDNLIRFFQLLSSSVKDQMEDIQTAERTKQVTGFR